MNTKKSAYQDIHYFKYLSLQNAKWFIDIILNKQLHASNVSELNDPMESFYSTTEGNLKKFTYKMKHEKAFVCSLSKESDNYLLWSHYADGHKGCCIEVSAKAPNKGFIEVEYDNRKAYKAKNREDINELLKYKLDCWKYENEVRYIRRDSHLYVYIHKVIFGMSTSSKDCNFYSKLIKSIDSNIDTVRIKDLNELKEPKF